MKSLAEFEILPQPNETTCGPTCLHAVYGFFGEQLSLESVINETRVLEDGGTLGVLLGSHALSRGYQAKIITYNLRVFDPSWFACPLPMPSGNRSGIPNLAKAPRIPPKYGFWERPPIVDLVDKLDNQIRAKDSIKLQMACRAYSNFIENGGRVVMHELNDTLLSHYLDQSIPILTGLSATYLYQSPRERQRDMKPDDIRGTPTGHFVVVSGHDPSTNQFRVADPYLPNPFNSDHYYEVTSDRLIGAILLGVLTYDSNLLIIQPGEASS